jgi:hypothetical protein
MSRCSGPRAIIADVTFVRRLPLVLLLATACTPKEDTKQAEKKDASPPDKQEQKQDEPKPDETPPQPATGPTYELIPGEAIGSVRVGMSKADVEALGMKVHPQFSAMTIPISVYYDEAEQAETIEISLVHTDKDVRIGEVTIPRTSSIEQIRELLGDCKEPQVNIGATMYPCRGGKVFIAIGSGSPEEIWLRTGKSKAYELVPNESIGPVRIGMSKAEIEALGILQTHPQYSGMTIPISVYYDDADKAKTIEVSFIHSPIDVTIGELLIPRSASVNEIRELLGDCQEPQVNKGGTMHSCRDGGVWIAIGSGNPEETWLRVTVPDSR